MPQKQVLILTLSALRPPWGALLDKAMQTWDSVEQPNTQTVFYIGMRAPPTHPKLFCSPRYDESLGTIGKRTTEAFQHSLSIPGWTHLARPHSSCYVHKRKLVEYVDTLPDTQVMCGLEAKTPTGQPFLAGCGHYIYSRDVIMQLVTHQEQWDHSLMEDNAVSKLAISLGIPFGKLRTCSIDRKQIIGIPDGSVSPEVKAEAERLGGAWLCMSYHSEHQPFVFTDFRELDKTDHFFFRIKQDCQRHVDLELMDLLFKNLT